MCSSFARPVYLQNIRVMQRKAPREAARVLRTINGSKHSRCSLRASIRQHLGSSLYRQAVA